MPLQEPNEAIFIKGPDGRMGPLALPKNPRRTHSPTNRGAFQVITEDNASISASNLTPCVPFSFRLQGNEAKLCRLPIISPSAPILT